jgi:phosphoglycolate phosphatase-like HAD superfamily hydrolase
VDDARRGSADGREPYRAVVFDFDGVLVESGDIKTEALLELFARFPQQREAIRSYHLQNVGVSRYRKFEHIYRNLLGLPFDEVTKERLGAAFSELVRHRVVACSFVPGAREMLEHLHGRCRLFVASATPHAELEWIVEARGLAPYFDGVWGTPHSKPGIARAIAREQALYGGQMLMVGDGLADYQAAQAAGIDFLARITDENRAVWCTLPVTGVRDMHEMRAWWEQRKQVKDMEFDHDQRG